MGIPDLPGAYVPLWDEEIPLQDRGPAFGKWVASYFHHDDLASRDVSRLNARNPDIEHKPTIEKMSADDFFSVVDFAPGPKCETILVEGAFINALAAQRDKLLFDPDTRKAWDGAKLWHIHGTSSTWNIVAAAWFLEDNGPADLGFKVMEGANHFVSIMSLFITKCVDVIQQPMWEDPARALECFQEIIQGSRKPCIWAWSSCILF